MPRKNDIEYSHDILALKDDLIRNLNWLQWELEQSSDKDPHALRQARKEVVRLCRQVSPQPLKGRLTKTEKDWIRNHRGKLTGKRMAEELGVGHQTVLRVLKTVA